MQKLLNALKMSAGDLESDRERGKLAMAKKSAARILKWKSEKRRTVFIGLFNLQSRDFFSAAPFR